MTFFTHSFAESLSYPGFIASIVPANRIPVDIDFENVSIKISEESKRYNVFPLVGICHIMKI